MGNSLNANVDELINAVSGDPNLDFWNKICHYEGGGSGPSYLCGWITAFTVFNDKGEWIGGSMVTSAPSVDDALYVKFGSKVYKTICELVGKEKQEYKWSFNKRLIDRYEKENIKGIIYPQIDTSDIVHSVATVHVTVDDYGVEYKTTLFAGIPFFSVENGDTVKPEPDCCLAIIEES